MFLKSLELKNYRKYYNDDNKKKYRTTFAHSRWENPEDQKNEEEKGDKVVKYISKSTSLIIGPNNSGKSTLINLLDTLQNAKAGSRNIFKHSDFNLMYLRKWYDKYISKNPIEKIRQIQSSDLPLIELTLTIGIDSKDDYIANFKDVLLISEIKKQSTKGTFEITITVKYECNNEKIFLSKLVDIQNKKINLSDLGVGGEVLETLSSDTKVNLRELQRIYYECPTTLKSKEEKEKLKSICDYYQESRFRDFLLLLDQGYYSLNFYPLDGNRAAKDFSLSSLLKVKAIQANTIKDKHTLSIAYNKIVNTYSKRDDLSNISNFIDGVNIGLKGEINKEVKPLLERVTNSIASIQDLKMNLHPNVKLDKILDNSVLYEYQEGKNYIPENQYGMGYTNLMAIIAELVDYFEKYEEEDVNGAINILCIEEPETYMHPEMQELFIKNISKAIASLMQKTDDKNMDRQDTFQIIISTHSPHILNSKIHSGNTLDNIMYLNSSEIINIEDSKIIGGATDPFVTLEYIKKYLRLELSDIFYADAVIFVEGQTEETYLRYLIDEDKHLRSHHIKVYRIDGAHGLKFVPLLKMLNLKTIILTDLDLNRTEDERKNYKIIDNLDNFTSQNKCITTNPTIKGVLNNQADTEKNTVINEKLKMKFKEEGYLKIKVYDNVHIYSQGKINNNYATSFEEAVILTNYQNKKIVELLREIHPNILEEKGKENLIEKSYFWQKKLSDSKAKFSNLMVYKLITEKDFFITIPNYIASALESLRKYFGEDNQ